MSSSVYCGVVLDYSVCDLDDSYIIPMNPLRLLRPRRVFLALPDEADFLYVSFAALMTCDRPPFFLYVPLRFMSAIVDFT